MSNCENYVSEEDIRALKESEQHIEHVARSRDSSGSKALSVTDTIRGESVTNRTLDGLEKLYTDKIESLGYQQMGDYATGINITARDQIVFYNGSWYMYRGELPHVTSGATLPEDGGIYSETNPDGTWVNMGDVSLRGDLLKYDGALNVGYKYPSSESVKRTVAKKLDDNVTLLDFGVVGDGIHDDTKALQIAVAYCISNRKNLTSAGVITCRTTDTLYIPSMPSHNVPLILDFGVIIKPDIEVHTVVASGEFINEAWVSSVGSPAMKYNSFGLTIKNITVLNENTDHALNRTGFSFIDLHQNTFLENLRCRNLANGFVFDNCFYLSTSRTQHMVSEVIPRIETTGYLFKRECNLMEIHKPIAVNVKNGYVFERTVTGFSMSSPSFEGQGVAIVTKGEVHDMSIRDPYLENVGDERGYCFDFQSYARISIDNGYFYPKKATSLFNVKPLPRSMIDFSRNNNVVGIDPKDYFHNKGLSFNRLNLIDTNPSSNLGNTLYRHSEMGSGVVVDKKVIHTTGSGVVTHITNVVNEFIPTNYAGKVNAGYADGYLYGLYNEIKDTNNGTCEFSTKIIYSNMQHLIVNIRVKDTVGEKFYMGTVWGSECRKPDGTVDSRITITNENDFVKVKISGISKGSFQTSGEIRVI